MKDKALDSSFTEQQLKEIKRITFNILTALSPRIANIELQLMAAKKNINKLTKTYPTNIIKAKTINTNNNTNTTKNKTSED